LLGLDLDGTVIDELGAVPEATHAALHACHAAGISLAFLTGRRPRTAGLLLESIGLPALVATNSGCLLWEYPGWRLLERRLLPQALIAPIAGLTAPYTVNFYCDTSQSPYEFIQLRRETTPETAEHLRRYGANVWTVEDAAEVVGHPVTQAALPAALGITERLRDRVRAALDGQVLALSVSWPLLPTVALEVFGSEATKGRALQYFAERTGVPRRACLAVGDDVNDLTMLEWAGHSVAMPHAGSEVRAAAVECLAGDGPRALAPHLEVLLRLPPWP
jgi:hypothetical protein